MAPASLTREPPRSAIPVRPIASFPGRSEEGTFLSTILVVDDEKNISQLVKMYLTNEGFEVVIAGDGAEVVDKARQLKPSLIVLDLMLPNVNGLDVCKQIRRDSDVPIIILTARG